MMAAQGIDVSRWQPPVDWGQVKASGRTFAIIKASGGDGAPNYTGTYTDPQYGQHVAGARAAGLLTGAYHFLGMGDGAAQARAFLAATNGYTDHELPPTVDYESCDANGQVKPNATILHAFIDELARLMPRRWTGPKGTPVPCMVYSGAAMAGRFRGDEDQYDLWHAAYVSPAAQPGFVPAPWTHAAVWQYSGTGQVPGVAGNCDCNVTLDDGWLARATGSTPTTGDWFDMATLDDLKAALQDDTVLSAIAKKVREELNGTLDAERAGRGEPQGRGPNLGAVVRTLTENHADAPTIKDNVERIVNATGAHP
jgi:GH25 family lysozyme M1 (1,4-beta-N-acetylmuramidase)